MRRPLSVNRLVGVAVCGCLLASPPWTAVQAQEEQDADVTRGTVFDPRFGIDRPYTRLKGDALPTYLVVEVFFYEASDFLARPPEVWNGFLRQLDIQPGTGAETALKVATLEARESILFGPPDALPPTSATEPEPTVAERVERQRRQVDRLTEIYASLLLDLAADGYPIERLHEYLEEQVRSGITHVISPEPGAAVNLEQLTLDEMRAFDDRLTAALAAEGARRSGQGGE